MSSTDQKPLPGKLIAVEGIDGSGKSTQIYLLRRWLELERYKVIFTEWNSSSLVKKATRRGKKKRLLTPTTFSLIHCTDFADRYERQILPLLRAGYLVLADRYVYTAFVRDVTRGCDREWVRNLYSFARHPDVTFFFDVPLETALARILEGRPQLKYHEAGMDLDLSPDPYESFRKFQGMLNDEYHNIAAQYNFVVIDASHRPDDQQQLVRNFIHQRIDLSKHRSKGSLQIHPGVLTARVPEQRFKSALGEAPEEKPLQSVNPTKDELTLQHVGDMAFPFQTNGSEKSFFGRGIPKVSLAQLKGKLLVVEGADGSGRSTQIDLLHKHLEVLGYPTIDVGLKRSRLVSAELQEALLGNTLSPVTMTLFYATDFADQLENSIIPALRAGFVVLADRYIYTLMAREVVRGMSRDWVRNVYSIALVPDAVFYLSVNPRILAERNLMKSGLLDFWESGMDISRSGDMYQCFVDYQRKMRSEFQGMATDYKFETINGNMSPLTIHKELRSKVEKLLLRLPPIESRHDQESVTNN
jgi:dTMP kinase